MNVKQLKELLKDVPDHIPVMVMVQNLLRPDMMAFAPACTCETGLAELGTDENGDGEGNLAFLVLQHGATMAEDDPQAEVVPELN
jgi:hypothetical protein